MGEVAIAEATEADALELAPQMRQADLEEVLAMGYADGLEALQASLAESQEAWAVRFDGELGGVFGVASVGIRQGVVWMLSGAVVDQHPKTFMRASRAAVQGLLLRWDLLVTLVDARYLAALQWAECLGFTFGAPVPFGPRGLSFVPISLRGA